MKKEIISLFLCVVLCLSLMPTMVLSAETPLSVLHVTGSITKVAAGELPVIDAEIAAGEHATVEHTGNTSWSKRVGSQVWQAVNGAAVADGVTHYAMRLCVNTASGYAITNDTKVYYNGTLYPDSVSSTFSWGGYIFIDLGLAQDDSSVTLHTVTFNTNGGTPMSAYTVVDGGTVNVAPPTKSACTFVGWYTDAACTVPFNLNTPITTDITLYAKWSDKQALTTLHIFGSVTEVFAGELPAIDAEIAGGEHAYVEHTGNTCWFKRPTGQSWQGLNGATAVADGSTHYAMRLCVNVDAGYTLADNTKIYYNGKPLSNCIGITAAWGGYVYVDLGTAINPNYDYYIDGVQITEKNKNDVFGNGKVRFYRKGEVNARANVIELNSYRLFENSGLGYYNYEKGKSAAMYFGEDTIVILNGESAVRGDDAYEGIVTAEYCRLEFVGDGLLYVNVGTENTAILSPGGKVTLNESVELELRGYRALDLSYTDHDVVVKDNANLYCYAYQNDAGSDGTALTGKGVAVFDNAEFTATSQYNGYAMYTWSNPYWSSDYIIRVLKMGEYENAQFSFDKKAHQPYLVTGLNTGTGVAEGSCRYINLQPKRAFVKIGDINRDDFVDAEDLSLLRGDILFELGSSNCDINGDKAVDVRDLVYLKLLVAGIA